VPTHRITVRRGSYRNWGARCACGDAIWSGCSDQPGALRLGLAHLRYMAAAR